MSKYTVCKTVVNQRLSDCYKTAN